MATKLAVTIAALSAPFAVVLGVALAVTFLAPAVTLTVDRPAYAVGDTVQFTLRNGLHDSVYLSCSAPWQILRDVNGQWQPVERHACLGIIVEVPSGSTRNWSWIAVTQADATGLAPVEPGQYRIDIAVLSGCNPTQGNCQTLRLSASFRLV
jgi:hypothetical protein